MNIAELPTNKTYASTSSLPRKPQTHNINNGANNSVTLPPPPPPPPLPILQHPTKQQHQKPNLGVYPSVIDNNNTTDATAMLTDSIGKINMGDKMNNFMTEAGKIISNMLEARIANNNNNKNNNIILTSGQNNNKVNGSSTKSPMVMRKRFDLDDFKDVDPTVPVALKPVVAVPQQISFSKSIQQQQQKQLVTEIGDHPMRSVIDICDAKGKLLNGSGGSISGTNKPPVLIPLNQVKHVKSTARSEPVAHPLQNTSSEILGSQVNQPNQNTNQNNTNNNELAPPETVIFRNKKANGNRKSELSTHAMDRRSYIERDGQIENAPLFNVSVKPLGNNNGSVGGSEGPSLSRETQEVVSQIIKDGKRPVCCHCNKEITRYVLRLMCLLHAQISDNLISFCFLFYSNFLLFICIIINSIDRGPFITALGRIWCPDHFICVNGNCRRALQDIGFVEEKGDLYCEYCFEKYLAPTCSNCAGKIKVNFFIFYLTTI